MNALPSDIRESLTEYDLQNIIDALVALHGRVPVADALLRHMPQYMPSQLLTHHEPTNPDEQDSVF